MIERTHPKKLFTSFTLFLGPKEDYFLTKTTAANIQNHNCWNIQGCFRGVNQEFCQSVGVKGDWTQYASEMSLNIQHDNGPLIFIMEAKTNYWGTNLVEIDCLNRAKDFSANAIHIKLVMIYSVAPKSYRKFPSTTLVISIKAYAFTFLLNEYLTRVNLESLNLYLKRQTTASYCLCDYTTYCRYKAPKRSTHLILLNRLRSFTLCRSKYRI